MAFEPKQEVERRRPPRQAGGAAAGSGWQWTGDPGPHGERAHHRHAISAREKSQRDGRDLIERLEAEWPALAAGPVCLRLRIWAEREPVLASFATPQQLLRQLDSMRSRHQARDEILAALLREARSDPLAARVVLQTLLPGLKKLAGRLLLEAAQRDELWSALLAHCWERIRRYPMERRPARIAANLLLDTLYETSREFKRQLRDRDRFGGEFPAENVAAAHVDRDIERLLQRAVAATAISADEAELILSTRVDGSDLQELAVEAGVSYHALNTRRLRAEKRLLLFLGYGAVTFRGPKAHVCGARAVGAGLTGSAGRGAATHQPRRR